MISNGYGELLQVMGRRFSDFLKGMDNLHEYFRFRFVGIFFHTDKTSRNHKVTISYAIYAYAAFFLCHTICIFLYFCGISLLLTRTTLCHSYPKAKMMYNFENQTYF